MCDRAYKRKQFLLTMHVASQAIWLVLIEIKKVIDKILCFVILLKKATYLENMVLKSVVDVVKMVKYTFR